MTNQELIDLVAERMNAAPFSPEAGEAVIALTNALTKEPEFAGPPRIRVPHGVQYVIPNFAAQRMLLIARETGNPVVAIEWLRKIPDLIAHGAAQGAATKVLCGVECEQVIPMSESVSLYPIHMLPPSRLRNDLFTRYERVFFEGPVSQGIVMPPRAALVRAGSPGDLSVNDALTYEQQPPATWFEVLDAAARLLALVSRAVPLEAAHWYHYDDPDVALLCQMGLAYRGSDFSQSQFMALAKVTAESVTGLLDAYLAMDKSHQDVVTLALDRLIRSRCQLGPGNRAIDLAIALEVLFMRADQGEHSFKIALRVARLLRENREARGIVFAQVRRLYDLRSLTVHTGRAKDTWSVGGAKTNSHALVEAVDLICAEAIRKFLALGRVPENDGWADTELG